MDTIRCKNISSFQGLNLYKQCLGKEKVFIREVSIFQGVLNQRSVPLKLVNVGTSTCVVNRDILLVSLSEVPLYLVGKTYIRISNVLEWVDELSDHSTDENDNHH